MNIKLKRIALKNRRHYLFERKADYKSEHWYRYVRSLGPYVEVIWITPNMAKQLIGDEFDLRKKIKYDKGVVISVSGKLVEGSTLLQKIINNAESTIITVTFNVPDR